MREGFPLWGVNITSGRARCGVGVLGTVLAVGNRNLHLSLAQVRWMCSIIP